MIKLKLGIAVVNIITKGIVPVLPLLVLDKPLVDFAVIFIIILFKGFL